MFLVPIKNDKLTLFGLKNEAIVNSYSSFKPGIYVNSTDVKITKLSSIEAINGITVELKSGVLFSNGPIKRKIQLPQPGDSVEFFLDIRKQDKLIGVVKSLSISNKTKNKLAVILEDDIKLNLLDLLNIIRSDGFSIFNKSTFLMLYKDYF